MLLLDMACASCAQQHWPAYALDLTTGAACMWINLAVTQAQIMHDIDLGIWTTPLDSQVCAPAHAGACRVAHAYTSDKCHVKVLSRSCEGLLRHQPAHKIRVFTTEPCSALHCQLATAMAYAYIG
eukprot:GHUV01003671.1.p1 GENE.GHUV01003671.1~~GHUV01003671.1.p1  ORF type:complete len:125 (+),score=14.26 GHUV01003671.1:905-1279(+)